MKKLSITILLLLSLAAIGLALFSHSATEKRLKSNHLPKKESHSRVNKELALRLRIKASDARTYAEKNNFNSRLGFLIDMSIPSWQKRFFIYDFQKDSIIRSGLVTHGNCNQYWLEKVKFDNTVGCGCSSVGKYKVGYSYFGRFGLAFKLYGLEKTNDNAFARYVVLHSHSCVPENETDSEICQSNGCPTVSPGFLKELEPVIKGSKKPVLLWIYK